MGVRLTAQCPLLRLQVRLHATARGLQPATVTLALGEATALTV